MKQFLVGLVIGGVLVTPVTAHPSVHKEVIRSAGPAFCPEDERLVPVKHHGYNAESVSGWTYTCYPWEKNRKMAP